MGVKRDVAAQQNRGGPPGFCLDSLGGHVYLGPMKVTTRVLLSAWATALLLAAAGCGPKYPKCDKDDQCKEKGEVCVESQCQQCRDATQCAAGQQCNGGRCEAKPECAADGECTGNQVCRSGKCQTECTGDGDCGAGMKCRTNRCVDKLSCTAPSDCGPGQGCKSGMCTSVDAVSRDLCTMPTLRFGFNEATLTEDMRKELTDLVPCLKAKNKVTIEGHADERGTEEYNLALGDRRARTVQKYLETLGLTSTQVDVISKGELEPVDNGHDEGAWAKNRRAEIEAR